VPSVFSYDWLTCAKGTYEIYDETYDDVEGLVFEICEFAPCHVILYGVHDIDLADSQFFKYDLVHGL